MVSTIISLSSSFSSIHIRKYCLSDRVLVMMKCGSRVNSTIKDDCYSPLPFQHNHSPLETLSFLDTVIRALCVVSPPPWHLYILLPCWLLFLYLMSHREGPQDSTLRPSFRFIQSLSLGEIFVPMVLVTLILPYGSECLVENTCISTSLSREGIYSY